MQKNVLIGVNAVRFVFGILIAFFTLYTKSHGFKNYLLKKSLTLLFLGIAFILSNAVQATHLVGGSMSYEYLGLQNSGQYRYRVTVKMYRDCAASTVEFDAQIDVGIYNNNSNKSLSKILTLPKISEVAVNPPSGGSNCSFQPNVCLRQAIYQGIIDLSSSTVGYHLVFKRCCRNTQVNILDDMGQTYYAFIPNTAINNSSPFFTDVPAPYICRNDLVSIYNTAKDSDGDSLVYQMSTPWSGGSDTDPAPTPPFNMPEIPNFQTVTYKSGFGTANPFGNSGVAQIDSRNGVTTLNSPLLGRFSIAIDVSEFRNGVLLSKIRLDIQMIVIDCPPNTVPDISTDNNSMNYSIMEGNELCFNVTGTDVDDDNIEIKGTGDIFTGGPGFGNVATFQKKSAKSTVTSRFCWTPSCGRARSAPYPVTFEINDDGCPSKKKLINVNITVTPFTGVGSITGPTQLCADVNGIVYTANGQAGSTYDWVVSGGVIVSGQGTKTITIDWDNVSFGTIKVKETSSGGCPGQEADLGVTFLPSPPKPSVAGNDTVCSFGAPATYSISPTSGYSYTWAVNGGNIISGAGTNQVNVQWGAPGYGWVRMFQTNNLGCSSEPDTLWVAIIQNEIDSLMGSPSVCPNIKGVVYKVQTPSFLASYVWTISQGTQSSGNNGPGITVDWGNPANGFVEVYEINKFGCVSDPVRMNVSIDHALQGMKPIGEDTLCEKTNGVRYRVIETKGSTYFWSVSGGFIVQDDSSGEVVVNWGPSGMGRINVYEISYDSVNNLPCIGDPEFLDVFLAPYPVVNPINGRDELCQSPDQELYYINGYDRSTYEWVFSGGSFTGQGNDSIHILPATPGTFQLAVRETSQYGCAGPLNVKQVIVHPKPTTTGIDGEPIICYPAYSGRIYEVQGFPTSVYNWSFDGGNIAAGQGTMQVSLDFNGQQDNKLSVQEISDFGCPGDSLHLDIFADNPSIDLKVVSVKSGDDTKMEIRWALVNAPKYNSVFHVQRRNAGTPTWQTVGKVETPTGVNYLDFGLNTDAIEYEYRIIGFNLCKDSLFSDMHTNVRITGEKPEDDAYAVNVYWTHYLGWTDGVNHYELYRRNGREEYGLVNNTGLDTFDFYDDGTKTFQQCYKVKSFENNSNEVSWSNEICFHFDPILFVPNAFTPNGDTRNDLYTWSYASINTFNIRIYDRWGELIYSGDSPDKFWDGMYRGTEAPDGVYIYVINYTGFDNRLVVLKGNITLLR